MKRFAFLVLCALMLAELSPHRGWANPAVFSPSEESRGAGDDDTPLPLRYSNGQSSRVLERVPARSPRTAIEPEHHLAEGPRMQRDTGQANGWLSCVRNVIVTRWILLLQVRTQDHDR